ncbi:MAG: hypothetical protein H8F28_17035, partial [Fibrella sp.]|nr:hypothetical protein [Armatimonadota bacterium]
MLFILPGILLIGAIALAIWALFFRAVLNQERTVREARQRNADFERWLSTPREPLYCVACLEIFAGPLPGTGCPKCHVRALVIPARTSDNPTVVAQAIPLPDPPVERGGATQGDSPTTVREAARPL